MPNPSWLRALTGRHPTTRHRRHRLDLGALEDRSLPSGTTFTSVAAASIHDGQLDGQGDSFNTVFDGLLRQTTAAEDRAVAEFDLASAAAGPVDLAVLDFSLAVNGQGTPLRTFDVYVYAGNGQGDLADFGAPGTRVGTVSLIGAEGGDTYRLDVTGAVRALLGGGNPVVGVRVDPVNDSSPSLFLDATLTVNGAPAPAGQRGWESIPNAIRMDGIDSFRLEVDVGGAVRAVTLAPFSIYLVPPNPGTVVLRDDGLGGDRAAGDFIYTSGAFRYDTSRTFPSDFFQGDPDSPAGVHIEDVGDVLVEELDGATSTFLLRPAVGLVRADLPLASSVQVTPDIVATEHLINVSTDAHATQRTLRGPANVIDRVTKPIYEQFRDAIDFFMFFSTNKVEQVPARTSGGNFRAGMHIDARVDAAGTGRDPFDNTAAYGSGGRLQGLNLLDAYQRGIWGANATHELVHQWSAYIDPALGVTEAGGHYNNHSSAGSLVGGFRWTPNGDGSYTIQFDEGRNGATHASDIDLYMMGLLDASEVDPIRAYSGPFKQPDNPVVQAGEITTTVTIEQVIARHGERPPAARRDFNLAFVAESHNRLLTPVELTFYDTFAAHYTKPVPAGSPDPRAGDGWASIARFFGHGSTWSSAAPPLRGLTADIVDVAPDPRATAVGQVGIVFSDPPTGFDLADLRLTRDGGANLLTGAETLSSADGVTWTLAGLSGLTGALGNYELTVVASGSGIQGPDGKPLVAGAVERWSKVPARVTLAVAPATLAEAGGTATVTASLSQVADADVSVDLAFAGTATPDADYTRSAARLTIPAGQTQASLTLTAVQDALDEADETVVVDVAGVTGAAEDGTQQATVAIADDDPAPTAGVSSPAAAEGDSGAAGLTFTVTLSNPSSQAVTVDYATADGTAAAGTDYAAAGGTLTFAPGETSKTVTVAVTGDLTDEPDETLKLNATLGGTTVTGTGTITNDDPLPTVGADSVAVNEGAIGATTNAVFTVSLSNPSSRTVTVDYRAADGTARAADNDYVPATGTLSFGPGETSKSVTVQVRGDATYEPDETFALDLSNPANATLGADGVGTIRNDDGLPAVRIAGGSVAEGNTGTRPIAFAVTLSNPSSQTVTVGYATADGSARAGSDYTAAGGTVTFAPGETSKAVAVTVAGDNVYEGNEQFAVNLSNPTNATVGTAQATGVITDDDRPTVTAASASVAEGDTGTASLVFTLTLSNPSAEAVTVNYATANGTAAAGSDYTAAGGSVTFAPGQTSRPVAVGVAGETNLEPDETLKLNLTLPAGTNAALGTASATGTIRNDDFAPVARAGPDQTADEGAAVAFDGSGSSDADGDALTYAWTFGDGTTGTGARPAHAYRDGGTFTVTLTVSDGHGGSATDTAVVTVRNVAPAAGLAVPATGVRGQSRTFTLTAADPGPADQAAPFSYRITWGDGTTGTASGPGSGTPAAHTYAAAGTYTVTVWAKDKDGLEGAGVSQSFTADAVEVQGTDLVVGGTPAGEAITVGATGTTDVYTVKIAGTVQGTYAVPGQIVVYAQAGADTVTFSTFKSRGVLYTVGQPLLLFGDDGNDVLDARNATGPGVLAGGAGNDTLYGGGGRDVLVGGAGADALVGGPADSLLLAGSTDYDLDPTGLAAVRAEWARADAGYAARRDHLRGPAGGLNGNYFMDAARAHDDGGAADTLTGGGGQDWFFTGTGDVTKDRAADETVTGL